MRTASCLALLRHRRNFTFAVTAHPSFLNLQITGVVIMATGVAGLILPRRRQQGWLRRRTILRRRPRGPLLGLVDENPLPPSSTFSPTLPRLKPTAVNPGFSPYPSPPILPFPIHPHPTRPPTRTPPS